MPDALSSPESLFRNAIGSPLKPLELVQRSYWKDLRLVRVEKEDGQNCYYETANTPWYRTDHRYCIPPSHAKKMFAVGKTKTLPISVNVLVPERGYEGHPRVIPILRVRPQGSKDQGEEVRSEVTLDIKITDLAGFEGITCIESTPESGLPKRACASSAGLGFSKLLPPGVTSQFNPSGWNRDSFYLGRKSLWRGKLARVEATVSLNCSTPLQNKDACEIVDVKSKKAQ